ncbi:MAG TPA: hypothetical protein ENI06_06090 [Spirochaetales bacterium]|nr:hypothetical protein [Spirochaetales bacterium]
MRNHWLPVVFLFFLLTPALFSEEKEFAPGEPRRLVLYFEQEEGLKFQELELLLLYESLLAKLSGASVGVVIIEAQSGGVPGTIEEKSHLAREQGADSWLSAMVSGSMESLRVYVSSFDLLKERMVFESRLQSELPVGLIDLARRFWDSTTQALRENYSLVAADAPPAKKKIIDSAEIVILAQPGTLVTGLSGKPLEVGQEGELSIELALPGTYSFEALKRGYYPYKEIFYLESESRVIEIDQQPGSRYALNFYLNNFSFPGFELSYYFIPNFFFARVGFNTFLLGIRVPDQDDSTDDDSWLQSHSLSHINITVGRYLGREDRYYRWLISGGLFTRLIMAKGYGIGFEPIAPFGVQAIIGLEFSHSEKKRLFLEYVPLLYLTKYPELMQASFPPDYEPWNYIFGKSYVIDFFNFRFGLRFQL